MSHAKRILATLAWLTTNAYAINEQQPPAATVGDLSQMVLTLLLILGLMVGGAWLLKRFGLARPGGSNMAKVVGGVSLGGRERIVIVEIADQWIVVGVGPGRVNSLATLPRQDIAQAPNQMPIGANFSLWLKQKIDKRNDN